MAIDEFAPLCSTLGNVYIYSITLIYIYILDVYGFNVTSQKKQTLLPTLQDILY